MVSLEGVCLVSKSFCQRIGCHVSGFVFGLVECCKLVAGG